MTPYYADDWLTVYQGDCRAVMAEMEPESVHCVVTSPPYWGLRDYGTASWDGGDEGCDHVERMARGDAGRVSTDDRPGNINPAPVDTPMRFKGACRKCGARRIDAQLGLESTPEAYVESMVAVFREVRRVLRSDGTVFLNLGDSYAGSGKGAWSNDETREANRHRVKETYVPTRAESPTAGIVPSGLKPKDLVGIPWRVAFALQADGWYLRSDIIWAKPNPMPESVTDRPTKAHEYLFLLSKSPRYYYDADAVREAESPNTASFVKMKERFTGERHEAIAKAALDSKRDDVNDRHQTVGLYAPQKSTGFRNLRSVWTIATAPYPGAHFATFPPKLVEPCIKAGSSEKGVCPECGAPWVRVVGDRPYPKELANASKAHGGIGNNLGGQRHQDWLDANPRPDLGWQPSCAHVSPLPPIGATVLDPFAGSGTTGMVAQSLSRRAVLIDLSVDYLKQLMDRNRDIPLGLGA